MDTQIGTCVSTLGRCIHLHSIRHLSFCIRAFDCPMVCLVVTPEFVVFCWFCLFFCLKLMITIIGGDFTRSWLSLPLSHGIKVKGGKNAIVSENVTKPSRFSHFSVDAQSTPPATQNDVWTSKMSPRPSVFNTFDFEMCFAPQRRALFRHLNFQKCSETASF